MFAVPAMSASADTAAALTRTRTTAARRRADALPLTQADGAAGCFGDVLFG
jgi:hypothetical protein